MNYKKSLQLDPGNQNAVGQLKKLQEPNCPDADEVVRRSTRPPWILVQPAWMSGPSRTGTAGAGD